MKHLLALVVTVLVWGLVASPAMAQEKDRGPRQEKERPDGGKDDRKDQDKEKGRDDEGKKERDKKDHDCTCRCEKERKAPEKHDCPGMSEEALRKKLGDRKGRDIREHMKKHRDGRCHCMCDHGKRRPGPPKKDGERPEKKEGDRPEKERKEPPKKERACDCDCGKHRDKGGKDERGDKDNDDKGDRGNDKGPEGEGKRKGNNGVGNGEDPQPPGNPPENDGPGTGKGKPGNRGGPKK